MTRMPEALLERYREARRARPATRAGKPRREKSSTVVIIFGKREGGKVG